MRIHRWFPRVQTGELLSTEKAIPAVALTPRQALWLVLALALALRLGFGLTRGGLTESSDERHWDSMARVFWLEGVLHPDGGTYRPPLYPLFLAGIYQVCGPWPGPVRLAQALLDTATCALLYGIGRHFGNAQTGLLAAGLGALYPLFIFFSAVLMAETLLVFLTTSALLLALRLAKAPAPGRALALGMALGLAGLCKPVVLAWVPFLPWGWPRCPGMGWPFRVKCLLALAAGLGLVIAPWTLRNALVIGQFVPISTNLGMNLMIGNERGATGVYKQGTDYLGMFDRITAPAGDDPMARERLAIRQVFGWILDAPLRFVRLGLHKLGHLWSPFLPEEPLLRNLVSLLSCGPILVLGIWGLVRLRTHPGAWAVGSLLLGLSLAHAVFFAHTRFRLPLDAALMGPAAWMLQQGWSKLHRHLREPAREPAP